MPTVERTIRFYRVDAGLDAAGRPQPFNPIPTLEYIDKLPWTTDGRYWNDGMGKTTCCWVDESKSRSKIRIGNIRRSDLPQVEQRGALTSLGISEQSGLAEQIHVIFFENNIVGCDFNFYGPRITRLEYYLAEKAVGVAPPTIHFEPLLRDDITEQLARIKYITFFQMKIRTSFAKVIADKDKSLGAGFEAAGRAGEADEVEIVLRPTPYSRGWLNEDLLGTVRKLKREPALQHESSKFLIKGYDREKEQIVKLDLLSDKLIAKRSIVTLNKRTRALDPKSAYSAIMSAFTELKDQLNKAASVKL